MFKVFSWYSIFANDILAKGSSFWQKLSSSIDEIVFGTYKSGILTLRFVRQTLIPLLMRWYFAKMWEWLYRILALCWQNFGTLVRWHLTRLLNGWIGLSAKTKRPPFPHRRKKENEKNILRNIFSFCPSIRMKKASKQSIFISISQKTSKQKHHRDKFFISENWSKIKW